MDLCHTFDRAAMADKRVLIDICSTPVPCGPKDVDAIIALDASVKKTNSASVAVRNFLFRFVLASEEERTTCAQAMIRFAHEHGILSCAPMKQQKQQAYVNPETTETKTKTDVEPPPPLPHQQQPPPNDNSSCFDCPACRWKRLPVGAALSLRPRGVDVNGSGEQAFSCVDWNNEMREVLSPEIVDAGKALLRNLSPRALKHIHLKDDNATLSYQVAVLSYDSTAKVYIIRRAREAEKRLVDHLRVRAHTQLQQHHQFPHRESGSDSESDL